MPHRDAIRIEEEELPGIGMRDDFVTENGRRVGVITYRDGHRDLLIYAAGDTDAVSETVSLTETEADILAEYLGTRRVIERLSHVTDQIDSLDSEKIHVRKGDPMDGLTLEEVNVKGNTGASIVAVWRDNNVTASPKAGFRVLGGDTLVVIGTEDSLQAAKRLINGV